MKMLQTSTPGKKREWLYDLFFIVVLLGAAYFRFSGAGWGDFDNQHPDENFISSVTLGIQPIGTPQDQLGTPPSLATQNWRSISPSAYPDCTKWGGYFDTNCSPLNPHNRGYSFYVYGDLPVIMTRYLATWLGQMNQLTLFGRYLSGVMDLGTIILLYLIVKRTYGPRFALLASAFSAVAVEQIQQSHFYTTDNFAVFFMFLTLYFAVLIGTGEWKMVTRKPVREPDADQDEDDDDQPAASSRIVQNLLDFARNPLTLLSLGFGIALGMATASKINAAAIAVTLPVALLVRYYRSNSQVDPQSAARRSRFEDFLTKTFIFLIVGAVVSVLAFRVFQPYAFNGLGLNPQWLENIREQRAQASPNADLPWALQWARRTHFYSFQNLTVWGLGLPLGILAWAGFLWMAWRMLKGEWRQHLLLWSWTAIYFVWQSLQYNPTMRYQLPIYPLLAMMAAWLVFRMWDAGRQKLTEDERAMGLRQRFPFSRIASIFVGGLVLGLTVIWAVMFSHIYTRPEPRAAATDWIFQNIPGPLNLHIQTGGGTAYQQPLPFGAGTLVHSDQPYQIPFSAQATGMIDEILLPHVSAQVDLNVTLWQNPGDPQPLATGNLTTPGQVVSADQVLGFDQPPALTSGQVYTLRVEVVNSSRQVNLCRPLQVSAQTDSGAVTLPIPPAAQCLVGADQPYEVQFVSGVNGVLSQIDFGQIADLIVPAEQTLSVTVTSLPDASSPVLAGQSVSADFIPRGDPRGGPVTLKFAQPVTVTKGQTFFLNLQTNGDDLALTGASFANETDVDYTLPFRADNYDPFGGIYRGDLNLQVYWEDNADKLSRFESVLGQSDYLFLPTAHQYTQITRLPERYPLTTVYYRNLLGCPADKDIIWCYKVAEPGMFHGTLGFDLVAVFTSYPNLGSFQINDQSVEEAFTFYDHPKTMIFKKNADYDPAKVAAILGAVDLSNVVHLTPGQADSYKSLLLPAQTLASQQAGGTWSDLFNRQAFYNLYPGLGVIVWYLVILFLGLITYPLVRAAFPGLGDRGYPLSRLVGLVLWAWLAWMAGSVGLTYTRLTIGIALGLIAVLGAWLAWRQRQELREELKTRWKYFLLVEAIFLSFFLVDLFIRLGNSDLWHPAKGGERPMDFAYLNAILKSTSFPPYDPWFAGGYINYYYYGYVIVGTPVKLLGIVPSIAYNFILPTLFACLAVGAFSVAWNLLDSIRGVTTSKPAGPEAVLPDGGHKPGLFDSRFIAGISASSAMVLLGNLGIVRMLYQGFQQVAATGGIPDKVNIFQRLLWAVEGFFMVLFGRMHLPYGPGDWYWFPSRALPDSSGNPITEFPLFTFIYSDLHAHMIAFFITVLAIAWTLSVLLSKARWKGWLETAIGLFFGALIIGALKPTNTWDVYTYLILASVVLFYVIVRYADVGKFLPELGSGIKRVLLGLGAVAVLAVGSLFLYAPFSHWYSQAYNSLDIWQYERSNVSSYLVHWGVFLFFIVSWMIWETRQWLADTPVTALRKLRPYRELILGGLVALILVLIGQQLWVMSPARGTPWKGVTILWIAMPLAVWAALLLFRPGLPDAKRLVLFMIGTSLLLTMVVEMVALRGDIGRMNTVFKFYLQVWIMLGISAAAAFGWLLPEFRKWLFGWRLTWQVAAFALTAGAGLFLLMGGMGKIQDRMSTDTPRTLDSMTYMAYSTYAEYDVDIDLSEDYRAIRWMQDNIKGSPVIAEAPSSGVQYTWLNRFSIYTGLPDVVGWEWHQTQQRLMQSNVVKDRGVEEDNFYSTPDANAAVAFLRKYNVRYIIVGKLERAKYTPGGLADPPGPNSFLPAGAPNGLVKFETYNGVFWHEIYRDGDTVIYEVNQDVQVNP